MATVIITHELLISELKELITATTSNYCNDDYNGDGDEVAELKWRTTKEPKTKRTTMTTKATNSLDHDKWLNY